MHFGFALELSDIDLWNIDLLDTHLDLLDTDIPSKYFACLHNVFKTSSRHVFKTSSRHVFKTSSRYVFKTSSRHVFKTSSRRLGRRKIVTLKTCWRRLQDQQIFAGNKLNGPYIKYVGVGTGGFLWESWNILGIYWWAMKCFSKILIGHKIFSYVLLFIILPFKLRGWSTKYPN